MVDTDYRKILLDDSAGNNRKVDAAIVALALARLMREPGVKGVGGNRDDHPFFTAAADDLTSFWCGGPADFDRKGLLRARSRVIRYARQAFTGPWGELVARGDVSAITKLYQSAALVKGSDSILQNELQEVMGYGAW